MNNSKRSLIMIIWSIISSLAIISSIEYAQYAGLSEGESGTLGVGVCVFVVGTLSAAIISMKQYW